MTVKLICQGYGLQFQFLVFPKLIHEGSERSIKRLCTTASICKKYAPSFKVEAQLIHLLLLEVKCTSTMHIKETEIDDVIGSKRQRDGFKRNIKPRLAHIRHQVSHGKGRGLPIAFMLDLGNPKEASTNGCFQVTLENFDFGKPWLWCFKASSISNDICA